MGVHDHHGPGNFRHLAQTKLARLFRRIDINNITRRKHLAYALDRLARAVCRFRPFDALERQDANLARLDDVAARIARRLQADARRLVVDVEHHREPPRIDIGQGFHIRERDAPVAGNIDLPNGPAPALGFVEIDQAVDHGLARQHLYFRIERGAHRQTAFVELLLSVILEDVTAHLLGEIFRRESVGAGRAHGDVERLLLGLVACISGDEAVLDHTVDDVVPARDGLFAAAERVIVVRAFWQRGEISGFSNGQLMN